MSESLHVHGSIGDEFGAVLRDTISENKRMGRDILAYRAALGYETPGSHDGRLSDGTFPLNGIAGALELRLIELEKKNTELQRLTDEAKPLVKQAWDALRAKTHTCVWTETMGLDEDYWDTKCQQSFTFMTAGPEENHFKFCPYCGGILELVRREAPDALES